MLAEMLLQVSRLPFGSACWETEWQGCMCTAAWDPAGQMRHLEASETNVTPSACLTLVARVGSGLSAILRPVLPVVKLGRLGPSPEGPGVAAMTK